MPVCLISDMNLQAVKEPHGMRKEREPAYKSKIFIDIMKVARVWSAWHHSPTKILASTSIPSGTPSSLCLNIATFHHKNYRGRNPSNELVSSKSRTAVPVNEKKKMAAYSKSISLSG